MIPPLSPVASCLTPTQVVLVPYCSEFGPEVQGEGNIDTLGLPALSDSRIGFFPGMTARMWRPRFLTAIAAASVIVEPFVDHLRERRYDSLCVLTAC
jgi:hypothetical protein